MRKPISNYEILKMIDTNIINYDDLKNYSRLDDLFKNDSVVLLIPPPKGSQCGHWVCLVRLPKNNSVFYHDSYGRKPDPDMYLDGRYPYLSKLLYESPYNLFYNEYDYQADSMSTCGRHCVVFILMMKAGESLENYHKLMKSFRNDDELVTIISTLMKKAKNLI